MQWVKNKYKGYRSECGRFYLQQSPKGFYQVHHRESADAEWGRRILHVCRSASEAKAFAEAI